MQYGRKYVMYAKCYFVLPALLFEKEKKTVCSYISGVNAPVTLGVQTCHVSSDTLEPSCGFFGCETNM